MIAFEETAFTGVLRVTPRAAPDVRGRFAKWFHAPSFAARGLVTAYAEHFCSSTKQGVVRGLHFQSPPADHAKLVCCLAGAAFDVVVDLRKNAPSYGQGLAFDLDADRPEALYIPSGFAHGFQALSDDTLMSYLVSTPHSPEHDHGIHWRSVAVTWPYPDAVSSDRDAGLPALMEFRSPF